MAERAAIRARGEKVLADIRAASTELAAVLDDLGGADTERVAELEAKIQQVREEAMDFLHGKNRPGGLDGRFAGPVGLVRAVIARAEAAEATVTRVTALADQALIGRDRMLATIHGEGASCGAVVCTADALVGPHSHNDGTLILRGES